ncbi:Thiosulfate:glutathione sulfurtransferase [Acropora cervicornis]|uniref:Thiosulfate:glutathione sulfurtransferase n=1 Tax=Acropora cervicornis TaxID=6130 RepID=A0AAD9R648_ACRCE|nr:Thiosulfate:glutathione sulfurtransferase [Acropora cervicornis]
MAFRQVGKFATSAFSQRYFSLVRAFSANAGPRERIWNCSKEAPGEIHLECLKDMLVDGDIQLFDVRETDEVASTGKIPLSINIPLNEIVTAFIMSPEEFLSKYNVPKPKVTDENLIFYCRSGKRAEKAVESVEKLGFEK